MIKEYINKAMNYEQYRDLLQDLMAQGKTTGQDHGAEYLDYAKMNLQRMLRLDKTAELTNELKQALLKVKSQYVWLVLTEGWCGDAAQNLPLLHLMQKECPNIELKLILRDENLELMDKYLTDGGRSIPKLICLKKDDSSTNGYKEIFTWGPRPEAVQKIMLELKAKHTSLAEKSLIIQKWYHSDKTLSTQLEFRVLVEKFLTN
jgi:hypothetical protein